MVDEEVAAPEEPAPKKKFPVVVPILVICAVGGAAAGVFVAGPLLLGEEAVAEAPAEKADEAEGSGSGSGHGSKGRESAPAMFSVENLVLNPAGTDGTRFLMVTVAFEVADAKAVEHMRGRDAEIRDILVRILGQRTIDQLTDLGMREPLREEIRTVMESRVPRGTIKRVYLPQFVIQ